MLTNILATIFVGGVSLAMIVIPFVRAFSTHRKNRRNGWHYLDYQVPVFVVFGLVAFVWIGFTGAMVIASIWR